MNRNMLTFLVVASALPMGGSPPAFAQADCSVEIDEIERRIATGTHPEMHVQVARQMQVSIRQMCAFLDEATKASFMTQLEDVLPTKSEEERQAERRARSAELKAQREARKREEAAAAAAVVVDPVLRAAPTAHSDGGRFVERADPMYHLWIWDWDTYGDKLRILYHAFPDRTQFSLPDWRNYIYVVEVARDGSTRQYLVTSEQESFNYGGIALRTGHDEVLLHRRTGNYGDTGTLERWSISGARQLSSVPAPNPHWPDGKSYDWGAFRVATSDGNVVFSNIKNKDGENDERTIAAWFEATADGRVLGMGSLGDGRHDYRSSGWFRTDNGGSGIVLEVVNTADPGVDSEVDTPVRHAIGGRDIHANVSREAHLLITGDQGSSAWRSAAIERDMMWAGDLAIPDSLPPTERLNQSDQYLRLVDEVANEYDANRGIGSLNVGPGRHLMIKPMRDGYGVLAEVTANRNLQPPLHGHYFLTVDESGVQKAAYLQPYAEQEDTKFTMLAISPSDEVYLHAHSQRSQETFVIRLDQDGKPQAYGPTAEGRNIVLEAMTADSAGAWIFGHAYRDKLKARLWVERIAFP